MGDGSGEGPQRRLIQGPPDGNIRRKEVRLYQRKMEDYSTLRLDKRYMFLACKGEKSCSFDIKRHFGLTESRCGLHYITQQDILGVEIL